jgi:predicted amidohydrolase YtcJ
MPQAQDHHNIVNATKSGADLIVFNASIFTGNRGLPEASAFAVKNGRISRLGPMPRSSS